LEVWQAQAGQGHVITAKAVREQARCGTQAEPELTPPLHEAVAGLEVGGGGVSDGQQAIRQAVAQAFLAVKLSLLPCVLGSRPPHLTAR
jgi:hypothetical protein